MKEVGTWPETQPNAVPRPHAQQIIHSARKHGRASWQPAVLFAARISARMYQDKPAADPVTGQ